jgi:predicted flap endonuclease-1-like 5' DNA nuclease
MIKKQYSKTKAVCKVTFTLPIEAAADAGEVKVLGDFNDWSWENGLAMKAGKAEYSAAAELATGRRYEFRYMIDQNRWENDYQADGYVPSAFPGIDNSVLVLEPSPAPEVKATGKSAKKASPAPKAKAAKSEPAKASPAPKAKSAPVKVAAVEKPKTSAQKTAPVAKDDLTKIEGIGPKIALLFSQAGIATFEALAKAKKAELKKILDAAGTRFQIHDPSTWPQQAKLAANGDWEKLAKVQEELKGGKKA